MAAVAYDISIEQGATWTESFIYCEDEAGLIPIDLTGWQGRGQIRATPSSPVILAPIVVTIPFPLTAEIVCVVEAAESDKIRLTGKTFRDVLVASYDVEIYKGTEVIRIANGAASISPNSTR